MEPEKKQIEYCIMHNLPLFAPKTGYCYSCGKYIYEDSKTKYKAGKEHITGCPFCNRSFCD